MFRTILLAAAALLASPAFASTFIIPAAVSSDYNACPKGIVTAEPGSTISAEQVELPSGVVTINLAPVGGIGSVEVRDCVFKISDAFTVARGSPTGSVQYAAPQGSTLIGIAKNTWAAADYLSGGPGDDRLEVVAMGSIAMGNGGNDTFVLPQPIVTSSYPLKPGTQRLYTVKEAKRLHIGKVTFTHDAKNDAAKGELVTRR